MILPYGLKFPPLPHKEADIPAWAQGIQGTITQMYNLLARSLSGLILQGLAADKPAAVNSGRLYWATDINVMYFDDGTWTAI